LSPEQQLLGRIKEHMAANLSRISSFTCVQTIERSRTTKSGRRLESDRLRLEVALVDGQELYSWPGASQFDERGIHSIVRQGAIGSGLFASFARGVFMESWPVYEPAGEQIVRGRHAGCFRYRVPLLGSGFELTIDEQKAKVGFSGDFCNDLDTLDLLRLTVQADDIPPYLGVSEVTHTMNYARVRLGETPVLLPYSAETVITRWSGEQSRNRTEFSGWRQYQGESALVLGEAPEPSAPAPPPVDRFVLPAGLMLLTRLESAIDTAAAAIGDPVTGRLEESLRVKGSVIVPKGAVLLGRVRWIEKQRGVRVLIALEFSELRFAASHARFSARLDDARGLGHRITALNPVQGIVTPRSGPVLSLPALTGVGWIVAPGDDVRVPAGLMMRWITEKP
ncbi:MAG: hypothetical protein ACRD96_15360, partial [Bryobacteraceae bacterium]